MDIKNLVKLTFLFSFGVLVVLFFPHNAKAATLAVSPTSNTVTVGSNFTVSVVLDTASQSVAGVDVYSLHFNPAVLQVVDADSGTSGIQITPGTLMPVNQYNTVNNATGVIQFSQISSTSGTNFTGTGNLASITFTTIASGNSTLTFDFTPGSTTDCNVAVLYSDVLTAVTNGSYTVSAGSDATAPSTPTSLSASSTSSSNVNLSWAASTDPTVANQTTSGVAGYQIFRCQGSSCTATVQVATSTVTSFSNPGLSANTVYGYRIKAYDNAGNIGSFSTAAYATTQPGAPVISNIVVSGLGQSSATVTWTTDTNSDSQVDYGLTSSYGSSSALNSSLVTSHSIPLSSLSAGTLYHYRVKSRDSFGNLTSSIDNTFTTQSAPDTTGPTVNVTSPSSSGQNVSATISVSATASDQIVTGQVTSGLQSLSLLIDGTVFASTTSGSISANLDTNTLTNTTHTITASAKDNAGNTMTTSGVSIIVFNLGNVTRYPRKLTLSGLEGLSAVPAGTTITGTVVSQSTGSTLETQTGLTADASSNYTVTFSSSDPQIVNIRVKSAGYLSQLLSTIDTSVNSGSALTVGQLLAGDFNDDNTVNSLDYSSMNSHWLQNFSQDDINRDGLVNSLDFSILKNNWNKSGQ